MELTTPNLLTLMRIALVPLLVWLLMYPAPGTSAMAAGVFFVATLSDFFDGYIARSYGSGTTLGKFLDPLADKLVIASALIMLAAMPRFPRVPAWMVVVLVTREIAVTGLRAMAAAEGQVMAAEELGKYKMVLQSIAIQGLLINYVYLDRKSTRLNSSHPSISYAVFCLKKKKKTKQGQQTSRRSNKYAEYAVQ